MKKQHCLFSPLIFLFVLMALGCENNGSSDQTGTTVSDQTSASGSNQTGATGQKSRLNNVVDWGSYRGDNEGSAYSSLSQITTENEKSLSIWRLWICGSQHG